MHISKRKKEDKTTFKIRIKTKAVSKPQVIGAFSPNFLPKKNFFSLVLRSNLRLTLTIWDCKRLVPAPPKFWPQGAEKVWSAWPKGHVLHIYHLSVFPFFWAQVRSLPGLVTNPVMLLRLHWCDSGWWSFLLPNYRYCYGCWCWYWETPFTIA